MQPSACRGPLDEHLGGGGLPDFDLHGWITQKAPDTLDGTHLASLAWDAASDAAQMHTASLIYTHHQQYQIRQATITLISNQWQETLMQDTIQAGNGD